jgi:DNA-binding SARP family transcriptional activator/tetratricopeptide (TPR) repeat protein
LEEEVRQSGPRQGVRQQAQLRVYLLGRFEVVRADAPIPAHAWRRRRPADLLKLVALAPGRSLSREKAIDALWPDKDPASGANNLHRALYDLRQILGGRWVDIDRGQLRLRGDAWVDVEAFERAVAQGGRGGFTQAVALYRGDLVLEEDGEHPDAAGMHARRAALRGRFVEAALPLAQAAAADGDVQLAIPLLRRVLEVDRTVEDAHRLLMRLLAESGHRADALRQYDACELAMRSAGLAASEETRQLRAAVVEGEIGPTRARPPLDGALRAARRVLGASEPQPVRGRGPLLLLLESLVEQGAGAIVLLGESGVGKTRLALEAARIAQGRGAAVLCGIAGTAPGVPYVLFQDALQHEARVNPSVPDPFVGAAAAGGVAGEEVRLAIFEGMERALRTIANGRPLFLLLDDLHLADESSLNLVHLVARHARDLRLMMVGTCSEDAVRAGTPIQTALAHLDCGRLARGVRVPRLGLAATREQVHDLLGEAVDEATLARIYRVTDGCPLLVEEIVRAYLESEEAVVPGDAASAIRGRVTRLGENAEAVLAAAAVAGTRFEFEPVRLVSGLSTHEAVAAVEACLAARIVDADVAGYHFHHALVRDAVYAGLPDERRKALHGALADALEAGSNGHEPPSEVLAHHRRHAGQGARAVRHLVSAGHRAAARAGLREALAFYGEAIELGGGDDGRTRFELLDAAGRVQLGLGEVGGAARTFRQAARAGTPGMPGGFLAEPAQRAGAHRLAAISLAAGGHLRAAHAEIEDGLDVAEQAAASQPQAELLHLRAQLLWHEGQHLEARAAAEACTAAAVQAGDVELAGRGRDLLILARGAMGAPIVPFDAALEPPRRDQEVRSEYLLDVHLFLWDRDLVASDCASVARLAWLHAERARMRAAPDALAVARLGEGAAALAMGRLDEAETALREALRGHRASGSALGEALALERLAALLTLRGWTDEAVELIDEGIVVAERAMLRQHALTRLHATEARNRLAAGAPYAAEDALREASETAARHGECVSCDAVFRPEAVRVLLARGRLLDADREAAQLEDIAVRRGGRVLGALAAVARARVLGAQGDRAAALAALAGARVAFADAGHKVEAARCARLERRLQGAAAGGEGTDLLDALEGFVLAEADV